VFYHELPAALDIRWSTSAAEAALAIGGQSAGGGGPGVDGNRGFVWCGQTAGTVSAVKSGVLIEIPLKVAVLKPGWVELGGCWVAWSCQAFPQLSGAALVGSRHLLVHVSEVDEGAT